VGRYFGICWSGAAGIGDRCKMLLEDLSVRKDNVEMSEVCFEQVLGRGVGTRHKEMILECKTRKIV